MWKSLDLYISYYDNMIQTRKFNSDVQDVCMQSFCKAYLLKYLIMEPTCYKSTNNLSPIDLFITNNSLCFQNLCVIEIGLFDLHKIAVTVMKTSFGKLKPNVMQFRDYKELCNGKFSQNLLSELLLQNLGDGFRKNFVLWTNLLQEKTNTDMEPTCLF